MKYQYEIIKQRRRSISVRIDNTGRISVRMPLSWTDKAAEAFIESKHAWIEKALARIEKRKTNAITLKHGEILYLGEIYLFEKSESSAKSVFIDNERKTIRSGLNLHDKKKLAEFYKEQARFLLPARVSKLARLHGFTYSSATVRLARSRWGSCTSIGAISLSERLILAPVAVIDSVIIHELTHTLVMNHSAKFYALLKDKCPDYDVADAWLKTKMPPDYPPTYPIKTTLLENKIIQ